MCGDSSPPYSLAVLARGGRGILASILVNLASQLNKDRGYLNNRLPVLADYGLLQKIGPAENSGLYQITPRGIVAVQNQTLYQQDTDRFEEVLDERETAITIEQPKITITTQTDE